MNYQEPQPVKRFEFHAFSSDVFFYAAGSGLLLIVGFIQTFLLAGALPVEQYGYWQLFNLYIIFTPLLHLGFLDGVLVRWAGKPLAQFVGEIKKSFTFIVLEQIILILPLLLIVLIVLQDPYRWIGVMVLAYGLIINVETFFVFVCQATRRFKLLTALTTSSATIFFGVIAFLYFTKVMEYHLVIGALLAIYLALVLAFILIYRNAFGTQYSANIWNGIFSFGKKNISIGIFILLGNCSMVFFQATDRLIISAFFPIEKFAVYAFAVSITGIAYIFIRTIGDVLFPYLAALIPEERIKYYSLARSTLLVLCGGVIAIYFPLVELVKQFFPLYVESLPVIRLLLATVGLYAIIRILQTNYFKAFGRQKAYFVIGIIMLAISIIVCILVASIWRNLELVAAATLINFIIWFLIGEIALSALTRTGWKPICKGTAGFMLYFSVLFMIALLPIWFVLQVVIYLICFAFITILIFRNDVMTLIKELIPGKRS